MLQGPQGAAGGADTAAEILSKVLTVDRPGSGLDADTLGSTTLAGLTAQINQIESQLNQVAEQQALGP